MKTLLSMDCSKSHSTSGILVALLMLTGGVNSHSAPSSGSHVSGRIVNHQGLGEPNLPVTVRATIEGREESILSLTDNQGHFLFEVPQAEWHIFVDEDELLARGYSRYPVAPIDSSMEEAFVILPNRPYLNPRLMTGGDVVLGLGYDTPVAKDLQVRHAYSIQASTDLREWFEIGTSSSIRPFAELQDPGAVGQSTRFYRAVLVESTFISVEEYYARLEGLDEFMSGILREGITLGEIETLRGFQAILKDTLEGIIANGGTPTDDLLTEFERRVDEIDNKLAGSPLLLSIEGVPVEIEISEAMRMIAEEYSRLGLVALNDYARLPGIDPEDLIGHETLAQYLDSRQVGIRTGIPVFQALSPYGNFTLIHALVVKYGAILLENTTDSDNDGIAEINYQIFRRMVNGTELAFREAIRLIEESVVQNPIPWDAINGSSIGGGPLQEVLEAISDLDHELRSQTEALVASKTLEAVFKNQMLNEINQEIDRIYLSNVARLRARVRPPAIDLDIIPSQSISFPPSPATRDELANLIDAVLSWNLSIRESLTSYMDGLLVGARLKNDFAQMLLQKLNGYRDQQLYVTGLYHSTFNRLDDRVRQGAVAFDLPGVGRVVLDLELDPIVNSLPRRKQDLLLFPGINQVLTEEDLEALHLASDWSPLIQVNLSELPQATSDQLSMFGLRVELTDLLLRAFGQRVVSHGRIDADAYFRALAMDSSLEELFDTSIGMVEIALANVDALGLNPEQGISGNDYQNLTQILLSTKAAVEDLMTPALDETIYQARSLVTSMLQTSFDRLVTKVDSLLALGLVRIDLEGVGHTVDANQLVSLLDSLAQRVSVISPTASPSRRHYARLNGITPEVLLELKDPVDQSRLRIIRLGPPIQPYTSSLDSRPDALEIRYVLVPEILDWLGNAIVNHGRVDLSLVEANLLQDVYVPVASGATIWSFHRQIVEAEIGNALDGLSALDFTQWSGHEQAEQIIIATLDRLVARVAPLIREVSEAEIKLLERDAQWGTYLGNGQYSISLRDLWTSYNSKRNVSAVSLAMEDGIVLRVPIAEIKRIPGFPNSATYDQQLFVGLDDSDFADTEAPANNLSYTQDGVLLTAFNRDRLVINVVTRHYRQLDQIPALYREQLFKDNGVTVEILRRLIKGVDLLHAQVLADMRQMTDEAVQRIQGLTEVPMTIQAVKLIYNAVAEFHGEVAEYLTELTHRHEREDVLELEEGVSEIYEDVIDQMISYLRGNALVIIIDGAEVEVPVHEITQRILDLLKARFPGEDIGAHHFASLFGISVEALRSYNKLEEFFGIQIVALPRNSQYVEILSKLSEIGLMELAAESMARYADEIVDVAAQTVDIARLMELLTDGPLAVQQAKARAGELLDQAIGKLGAVEEPDTFAGVQEIANVFNEAKLELVNSLNDVVSGFSDDMRDEVQAHLDDLYVRLVAERDALVIGRSISFQTTDGIDFSVNLSEIEGSVVGQIVTLVAATEEGIPSEVFVSSDGLWGRPIWHPLPDRFDPEDTLTRFGFHLLMARLVDRYSDFVLQDGTFSLEKFLFELGRTDLERATESFDEIRAQTLIALENLVPANGGPVHLDQVTVVHSFLDDAKKRFLKVLDQFIGDQTHFYEIIDIGNQAWAAVMNRYEELLFSRLVTVALDGKTVTIDVQALMEIMQDEYDKGHTLFLNSYVEGGENRWSYERYKVLYSYYWWELAPMPDVTQSLSGNEVNAPQVENPLYPFNLGELNSVPGINARDLAGLDVESKDRVQLSFIDPKELLKGRLNMRVFAPGSALQTIGLGDRAASSPPGMWVGESMPDEIYWIVGFRDLSERDIKFRVIPAIIQDFAEELIDANGELDLEKLLDLLEDGQIDGES